MDDPRNEVGETYLKKIAAQARPAWAKTSVCIDCGVRLPQDEGEHDGPLTHHDGCPYVASMDETSAGDRLFFETHPYATEYRRKPSYSETADIRMMQGLDLEGTFHGRVRVLRIKEYMRSRYLGDVYFVPGEPNVFE